MFKLRKELRKGNEIMLKDLKRVIEIRSNIEDYSIDEVMRAYTEFGCYELETLIDMYEKEKEYMRNAVYDDESDYGDPDDYDDDDFWE